MPRAWIWLQVVVGWLPVGALFAMMMLTAHPDVRPAGAVLVSLRMMVTAALLGLVVHRLARRLPWPHPFRLGFVAVHFVAASVYAVAWIALNSLIESVHRGQAVLVVGYALGPFVVLGVWIYVMIAGVAYASLATERAAHAEAAAVRSQLAALRAQLNPHFLFNALHTVVQLIPREPVRAARAAEQVAGLLRTTLEEDRDLVPLADEWDFVRRYLEVEGLRLGERLIVHSELSPDARDSRVPSFAVQTLVENAVRHGAAPRVEPTTISVMARRAGDLLTVTVSDTGAGAANGEVRSNGGGTGLRRLRDRLSALYGARARLDLRAGEAGGFTATMEIPQLPGE
jgi:signal transduction histidine kinase